MEFLTRLFDTSDFPARWDCGHWTPGHGRLHVLSDLGVWSAYFAIPLVFGYFLARRKDLPFRSIVLLFAAFILLCGLTHLMEAVIFWWPAYRVAGVLKLATAVVSWATVLALVRVAPSILAMRSPGELEREIAARKEAERRLEGANEELERRVAERTAELTAANERLRESEGRFRLAAEAVNGLIYDYDVAAGTVWRSSGLKGLVGYAPDEAEPTPDWWFRLAHPDDVRGGERQAADLYAGSAATFDAEYRVRHRDGHSVHVWERGQVVRGADGRPVRVVGSTVDVTARKEREAAVARANRRLGESVALLDTFLSAAPVGLTFLDPDFRFVRINPVLAALNGRPVEAHLGRAVAEVLPQLWPAVEGFLRRVRETGEPVVGVEVLGPIPGRGIEDGVWEASYYPVRAGDALLGYGIVVQDVTDRKRAEREMTGLVRRLTTLVDNTPLGVVEWDADFRIARWSGQAEKVFGWTAAEVVGRRIDAVPLTYEADRPKVEAAMARLADPANPFVVSRNRNNTKSGGVVACEWYNSVLHDEAGRMVAILSLVLDVTERERAEEELRASEQRFQRFMDNGPTTAFIKDGEGRYVYVNRLLEEKFHRPAAEWVGRTDADLFPAAEAEQYRANDRAVLESGTTVMAEEPMDAGDGTHHYLSFKFPIEGRDGRRLVGGMALDITERKRAEQDAEEGRRILDGIMRHAPEGITVADAPDATIRMVSRYGLELVGRPAESVVGIPDATHPERWGLCHPDTGRLARPDELPLARAVRRGEVVTNEEWAICRPDGTRVPILCNAGPIRGVDGEVVGGVVAWRDITDRKEAEGRLRASEERFRLVAAAANDGFWDYDLSAGRVWWNDAYDRLYGPRPADTGGSTDWWAERLHPDDRDRVVASFRQAVGGDAERWVAEYRFRKADGSYAYVMDRGLVSRDATGKAVRMAGSMLDLTRLKEAEAALREQDRRKDEFLATLAHELRNPLAPIRTAIQILTVKGSPDPDARRMRDMIERQVNHMVRLVDDLLDVSRISRGKIELHKARVRLAEVVQNAVETSGPTVEAGKHRLTVTACLPGAAGRRGGRGAADAGGGQPAEQRRQVHPGRGPHLRRRGPGRAGGGDPGPGLRAGYPCRHAGPGVRDVHAGQPALGPVAGRAGDRADAGAAAGGNARRDGRGPQRGRRQGGRVRCPPAACGPAAPGGRRAGRPARGGSRVLAPRPRRGRQRGRRREPRHAAGDRRPRSRHRPRRPDRAGAGGGVPAGRDAARPGNAGDGRVRDGAPGTGNARGAETGLGGPDRVGPRRRPSPNE